MSDRDAFREARAIGKAKHHEQRLEHATYTAAEVKVLTETASKVAYELGRKDAGEEIAAALVKAGEERSKDRHHKDVEPRDHGSTRYAAYLDAATIARNLPPQPTQPASDAISGVPRHSEVSEAPKAPRECPGCGQNGTGLESHDSDCPQNPYYEEPK